MQQSVSLENLLPLCSFGPTKFYSYSAWTTTGTPVHGITMLQDPRATPLSSAVQLSTHHGGCYGRWEYKTSLQLFNLPDLLTVPDGKISFYCTSTVYLGLYTPLYMYPLSIQSKNRQWRVCDTMVLGHGEASYIELPTEEWEKKC